MIKKSVHYWAFTFITLTSGLIWLIYSAPDPQTVTGGLIPAPKQGFLAPDFALKTITGETIRFSELDDKVVLINFWASWCFPCRAEMPAMQQVYLDYQHLGLEILAVNATNQDSLSSILNFVEEYGLTFPILLDNDGEISRKYQVRSLPSSFFVDKNGIVDDVIIGGPMAEALLRIRIEELMEKGE
jgi:cytochrome c biogenesis protein CcmG, thiol:disulfide interchange protein DsbE